MNDKHQLDWNPKAADVLRDQRAAYDAMRERCPVAYSELLPSRDFTRRTTRTDGNEPLRNKFELGLGVRRRIGLGVWNFIVQSIVLEQSRQDVGERFDADIAGDVIAIAMCK
jgi:hypothetical protein